MAPRHSSMLWNISGKSETGERLSEIVTSCIMQSDEIYKTKIYAVISDNAANMVKMCQILNSQV